MMKYIRPDREDQPYSKPIPQFLIAGPNFGKISSLHEYCLGITCASRLLASRRTVYAKTYSELYTGIPQVLLYDRYNLHPRKSIVSHLPRKSIVGSWRSGSFDYKISRLKRKWINRDAEYFSVAF